MPDQYTIRPLEYCALDCTISYTDALSQPAEFYQNLTEKINLWKKQQIGNLPEIITFAFLLFLKSPKILTLILPSDGRIGWMQSPVD